MPHFEWLALAGSGPAATRIWARVLLAVVLGWLLAVLVLIAVWLIR